MRREEDKKWPKIRLRWGRIFLLFIVTPLFLAYVGSYVYLSRRGMQEAQPLHFHGFLYVPMEELSEEGLLEHHRREGFYAPANWVDRTFFGGDWPVRSVDFASAGEGS